MCVVSWGSSVAGAHPWTWHRLVFHLTSDGAVAEHYGFALDGNPHDAAQLPADAVARCGPDLLVHAPQAALQVRLHPESLQSP